ncbi:MAG TPA: C-terminal binding protein [Candidatus Angelobacter sp.]|jgi:phosphoglycerate dehydrogenase-like enzyme|nr:C-terminal binding protein [Candidatus Angelobacter sp.]
MPKPVVVYSDLPWAIGKNGSEDPSVATIEHEVFGNEFDLRFTPATGGRHQIEGPSFLNSLRGADALVIYRCAIRNEVLDAAGPNLKVVARQGVGYDNLAPELLESRGIVGFNIPDYCVDEVATHTMALLLALERGLIPQHFGLSQGKFDIYAGGIPRRTQNHTAGIIGFGRIGRAVSVRLKAFYRNVVACDPYVDRDMMEAYGVTKVDLDTLLANSDAVSLHCLLNPETTGMFNARAFAKMKAGAFFINAARGALVESLALYEALSQGRIAGAGIDVFSPEDPHKDEWYAKVVKLPNVVVSSHRAFLSVESADSQRRRTAEGILGVLKDGRPPAAGHLTLGLEQRMKCKTNGSRS